jgi:anti-sigma factor RsiW
MNKCSETEIQEMLPDLAHGSLDGRERQRVEAHLATCESCREDLDVIRTVKSAAVFAPTIDVEGVVRHIPPYRTILPAVEKPARPRVGSGWSRRPCWAQWWAEGLRSLTTSFAIVRISSPLSRPNPRKG